MYSVQCIVYSVHCTLYSVHCTLYSVHCTVQCPVGIPVVRPASSAGSVGQSSNTWLGNSRGGGKSTRSLHWHNTATISSTTHSQQYGDWRCVNQICQSLKNRKFNLDLFCQSSFVFCPLCNPLHCNICHGGFSAAGVTVMTMSRKGQV